MQSGSINKSEIKMSMKGRKNVMIRINCVYYDLISGKCNHPKRKKTLGLWKKMCMDVYSFGECEKRKEYPRPEPPPVQPPSILPIPQIEHRPYTGWVIETWENKPN